MRRSPRTLGALLLAAAATAASIDDLAELQGASIARSGVGAWVKARTAAGTEITSTLLEKRETPDGWMVKNRIEPGGESAALVGSAAGLAREGTVVASVSEEIVEVGGRSVSCSLFTMKNGQRHWVSADVPMGGLVRIEGADGKPLMTLLDWGTGS